MGSSRAPSAGAAGERLRLPATVFLVLLWGAGGPAAADPRPPAGQPEAAAAGARAPEAPVGEPDAADREGERTADGGDSRQEGAAAARPRRRPRRRPAAGEPAAQAPDPNRIRFQLPFSEERGGGTATGTAGVIEYLRDDAVLLSGGVELRYRDLRLEAERVEADLTAKVVRAEGEVVIDQGPQRLTGATATWDLEARTGSLTDASAFLDPDIYVSGAQVAKVGEALYTFEEGTFTSCSDEVPDWSFRARRARVEMEGYARVRGASMRVKKLPVLYSPYILWPAKRERASGFLVPQPGYSDDRGTSLSMAYFQTLGRSYDATLFTDLYSEEYLGLGTELRWAPAEGTEGLFEAYAIHTPAADRDPGTPEDPGDDLDAWRWKISLDHVMEELPLGLRAIVAYRDYSDFDYLQDIERSFDRNSARSVYSRGTISGNWGPHSLNLLLDSRETLVTNAAGQRSAVTLRQLPIVEYSLRETRVGATPLYFKVAGSGAFLSQRRTQALDGDYGRFDLFPNLRLPIGSLPWLDLSVSAGQRFTWWGDSLCRPAAGSGEGDPDVCGPEGRTFTGESLSRTFPVAGVEMVGPSFSRVFNRRIGPFAKMMHIIQPRWEYGYQGDVDEAENQRIPQFDSVDSRLRSRSVGRFALVNIVKVKPVVEEPPAKRRRGGRAGKGAAEPPAAGGEAGAEEPSGGGEAAGAGEAGEGGEGEDTGGEPEAEAAGEGGEGEDAGGEAEEDELEVPAGGGGSGEELLRLEIAQSYSLDREQPLQVGEVDGEVRELQEGPITAQLEVKSGADLYLRTAWSYSTLFNRVTSRSVSGNVGLPGGNSVGLSWFTGFNASTGETTNDQIQLTAGLNLIRDRLRLDARVGFDLDPDETEDRSYMLLNQSYTLRYTSQCYALRLEVREFTAGDRRDRDYRLAVSLKNVGTFLDLSGRQSNADDF